MTAQRHFHPSQRHQATSHCPLIFMIQLVVLTEKQCGAFFGRTSESITDVILSSMTKLPAGKQHKCPICVCLPENALPDPNQSVSLQALTG